MRVESLLSCRYCQAVIWVCGSSTWGWNTSLFCKSSPPSSHPVTATPAKAHSRLIHNAFFQVFMILFFKDKILFQMPFPSIAGVLYQQGIVVKHIPVNGEKDLILAPKTGLRHTVIRLTLIDYRRHDLEDHAVADKVTPSPYLPILYHLTLKHNSIQQRAVDRKVDSGVGRQTGSRMHVNDVFERVRGVSGFLPCHGIQQIDPGQPVERRI